MRNRVNLTRTNCDIYLSVIKLKTKYYADISRLQSAHVKLQSELYWIYICLKILLLFHISFGGSQSDKALDSHLVYQ